MPTISSEFLTMCPNHFELLTDADKREYQKIRTEIQPYTIRTTKEKAALNFKYIMLRLGEFINRGEEDDWKRALVCGIAWLESAFAISTRQLQYLFGKCKSSINAGFQSIGYVAVQTSPQMVDDFISLFPFMIFNNIEVRQWTLRYHTAMLSNKSIIAENSEESCSEPSSPSNLPEETPKIKLQTYRKGRKYKKRDQTQSFDFSLNEDLRKELNSDESDYSQVPVFPDVFDLNNSSYLEEDFELGFVPFE